MKRLFISKSYRNRGRDKESKKGMEVGLSISWLLSKRPQQPEWGQVKPRRFFQISQLGAEAQVVWSSSTAFPGTSAVIWERSGAASVQTGNHMQCQHWVQWLTLACHNSSFMIISTIYRFLEKIKKVFQLSTDAICIKSWHCLDSKYEQWQ